MLPIKRILCPTDFSEFSVSALEKAGELARHFGAEVCALHVTQALQTVYCVAPFSGGAPSDVAAFQRSLREGARRELGELIERPLFSGIAVRPLLREGRPADEIIRAAQTEGADLILIATHGRSGWRHLMLGSVAEAVVRLAPCPVLVIPAEKPPSE